MDKESCFILDKAIKQNLKTVMLTNSGGNACDRVKIAPNSSNVGMNIDKKISIDISKV